MPRIALAALAALYTSTAFPAVAQQQIQCVPDVAMMAKALGGQFGEKLNAAGVDANGSMVQVYTNPKSGTWTIVVSIPKGPTCIVSSGESWASEPVAAVTPGRSS